MAAMKQAMEAQGDGRLWRRRALLVYTKAETLKKHELLYENVSRSMISHLICELNHWRNSALRSVGTELLAHRIWSMVISLLFNNASYF